MNKILLKLIIFFIAFPLSIQAEVLPDAPFNVKIKAGRLETTVYWENPTDDDFIKTTLYYSTVPIENYFSFQAVDPFCDKIYEGNDESFIVRNLAPNLPYYFILFASYKGNEYSKAVVLMREADLEEEIVIEDKSNVDNKTGTANNNSNIQNSLAGATATIVNEVSFNEAEIVYNYNQKVEFSENSENRRLSLFIIVKSPHDLSDQDINAISYFIDQGTPTTIFLGSGERTGVLNSYLSVFNKLPRDILEWQDVIKIANGRWPNQRNLEAEEKAAAETFSSIYQREADTNNAFDNAAITVIAYGLRSANRNMESEAAAIKIYESIFNKAPQEAYEWDMVRAIAYSGATR